MKFYFICGVVVILIGALASIQTIKELDAKYNGEVIEGQCLETPIYCSRRNSRIEIKYQNEDYSV